MLCDALQHRRPLALLARHVGAKSLRTHGATSPMRGAPRAATALIAACASLFYSQAQQSSGEAAVHAYPGTNCTNSTKWYFDVLVLKPRNVFSVSVSSFCPLSRYK